MEEKLREEAKEEYEIQLYDFTLKELKLSTRLFILTTTNKLIFKIEQALVRKGLLNSSGERTKESNHVYITIAEKIAKSLKVFNENVDKHFSIPNSVVLQENESHKMIQKAKNISEQDIIDLESKLMTIRVLKMKIKFELELHKKYETQIDDEHNFIQTVNNYCLMKKNSNSIDVAKESTLIVSIEKLHNIKP